jgi:hypothetical protein
MMTPIESAVLLKFVDTKVPPVVTQFGSPVAERMTLIDQTAIGMFSPSTRMPPIGMTRFSVRVRFMGKNQTAIESSLWSFALGGSRVILADILLIAANSGSGSGKPRQCGGPPIRRCSAPKGLDETVHRGCSGDDGLNSRSDCRV